MSKKILLRPLKFKTGDLVVFDNPRWQHEPMICISKIADNTGNPGWSGIAWRVYDINGQSFQTYDEFQLKPF